MKLLTTTLLLLLCSCASQTRIPAPVRAAISARHLGRAVELRHSCYYGDLYDENEKWLLSPYPFAETYHIVDLDGAPIHPHGQRGVIPAGTPFVIKEIEFPDTAALAKRMLTTPRYNPWVYLTPASEAVGLPAGRSFFILLLPMDLESETTVEKALNEALAPKGEVSAWLAARRPTVQAAIGNKEAIAGMSEAEVVAALGSPPRWFAEQNGTIPVRVAWYPGREVWLEKDTVTEVKPARPEPAPVVAPPGSTPPAAGAASGSPPPATKQQPAPPLSP
ncbi:MAG: hypothetical protein HY903_07380 [Deltaproteobacteria bacterium]|nr:hypothetical protein [Deltaproteobacteria bacterium]